MIQTARIRLYLALSAEEGARRRETYLGMISRRYSICFARRFRSVISVLPPPIRLFESSPKMTVFGGSVSVEEGSSGRRMVPAAVRRVEDELESRGGREGERRTEGTVMGDDHT